MEVVHKMLATSEQDGRKFKNSINPSGSRRTPPPHGGERGGGGPRFTPSAQPCFELLFEGCAHRFQGIVDVIRDQINKAEDAVNDDFGVSDHIAGGKNHVERTCVERQ